MSLDTRGVQIPNGSKNPDDEQESTTYATVSSHPALADIYKQKINQLANVLIDPKIRSQATLLIRELIERVDIDYNENSWDTAIKGDISALVSSA